MTLRLGTRGSALARTQSQWVADRVAAASGEPVELVVISTKGDRDQRSALSRIGGKGLFTAELEAALRDRTIDFAVHSLKDLPTADPEGLGEDPVMDRYARNCHDGDMEACDTLFRKSERDSEYETYGGTCAGRQAIEDATTVYCRNAFPTD